MAVKRRIIWMSDEDWAILQTSAKDRDTTVSELLRPKVNPIKDVEDYILSQPQGIFTKAFRPAPKPGKGK